jgi:hypothetical protein
MRCRGVVEDADDLDAVFDGVAEDVGDDDGCGDGLRRRGSFSFDEGLDAHVLQADGVHHAGGGLDDARAGLPAMGSRERPLVTKAPMRSSETISSNSTP